MIASIEIAQADIEAIKSVIVPHPNLVKILAVTTELFGEVEESPSKSQKKKFKAKKMTPDQISFKWQVEHILKINLQ